MSEGEDDDGDGDGDIARIMAASVDAVCPFVPRTITLPCSTLS